MRGMGPEAAEVFARGVEALDANDFNTAESLFRAIVEANPRAHEAWNALALVAVHGGAPDIAEARARQALELDRRNPVYLNNFGIACGELGRFDEAEAAFRRALKLRRVYPEGLFNLGKVLHKQGRLGESLKAYERAYAMYPGFPGLRLNLAQLYQLHARADRALAVLREAPGGVDESLAPTYASCLVDLQGPSSAIDWMKAAAVKHPQWHRLKFALALTSLSVGQWREGWEHYAWRTSVPAAQRAGHHCGPLPARLEGKRVLLRNDEGLGDALFFLRFEAQLRERGAQVLLQCPPALVAVLEASHVPFEATSSPVDTGAFDFSLWIGDLPAALETQATPGPLRLRCDEESRRRIASRLAAFGPPPYLGVTWRAGTDVLRGQEYGNVRAALSKEIRPATLGGALRGWPGTLLCLQRNPYPGEIDAVAAAAGAKVHDLSASNADLVEMLAIQSLIRDYVAVSNTNVHLLAGLGRTASILVPYPADWRWMHDAEASVWFPGFNVYRQSLSRDWSEPLARLRADLLA